MAERKGPFSPKSPFMITIYVLILLILGIAYIIWGTGPAPTVAKRFSPYRPKVEIADHSEVFKKFNITRYEGSKTCMMCHEEEVKEVFHSAHYQMANLVNDIEGKGDVLVGSKIMYNDFCGSIFWQGEKPVNWIGNATLKVPPPGKEELKGKFLASGCSMCHGVSLGAIPKPEMTEEQLENIDCLVCHHLEYRGGAAGVKKGYRKLVKTEQGFRYVPNPDLDAIELAKKITAKPTKEACLWCHAFAGGGPGFKRPNIDPSLIGEVSEDVDVHLARGMQCIDCHVFEDHKVATKAVDTWHRQTDKAPTCEQCHEQRHTKPVIGWIIKTFHEEKIACQTCHIPRIAKKYKTDVVRMWNVTEWNDINHKWFAKLVMAGNITPTYAWWNGRTRKVYVYPEKAQLKDGTLTYAAPVGSHEDGKIYPFKYHYAYIPFDSKAGIPVPTKVGAVFTANKVDKMVELGEKISGLKADTWIKLERYMQVDHGVEPAEKALWCTDCHGIWKTKLDYEKLGYGLYPKIAFTVVMFVIIAVVAGILYIAWKKSK